MTTGLRPFLGRIRRSARDSACAPASASDFLVRSSWAHESLAPETLPPLAPDSGVSVIMPVLNEAGRVQNALRAILAQDYRGPVEIIVAVGPSTDETKERVLEIAEGLPTERDSRADTEHASAGRNVIALDNPTGDTPNGLNLAIAQSRYPVVVRIDAHSEIPTDYVSAGVAVLRETGAANVGGLMVARGRTAKQRAVARAYMSKLGLGGAAYHAGREAGPAESAYLGIFRAEVFERVGRFDPTLRRGQDWELNLRIRTAGGVVYFSPTLEVTYWPRETLGRLRRQFFSTGVWRAEIIRRHGPAGSLRFFAPPLLVLGLAAAGMEALAQLSGTTRKWPCWLRRFTSLVHVVPASYVSVLVAATWRAQDASLGEKLWFSVVLPTMHISWGLGFLRGILRGAGSVADTSR